jgi:uncharacterized protein with ATP-grasp and redox domains
MDKGNVEAADKISQKLMAIVEENDPFVQLENQAKAQSQAKDEVIQLEAKDKSIKKPSALPAWMGGSDNEPEKSDLPNWMK